MRADPLQDMMTYKTCHEQIDRLALLLPRTPSNGQIAISLD